MATSILQGLGRLGSDIGGGKEIANQWKQQQAEEQLRQFQAKMQMSEFQQRVAESKQRTGQWQQEFDQKQKLANQPTFLGFQKVGSRVMYGIQKPDGTIETKEAPGFDESDVATQIETSIKSLPEGVGQQAARAAVAPYIMGGDYPGAMNALKPYLLQYGKSGLPGSVSVSDTTTTQTIDTPDGPKLVQIPKHTVTRRGVGDGTATPQAKPSASSPSASAKPTTPYNVVGDAKPTGAQMNRADLAKNVNENLDQLADIVKRRPELFGKFHGRLTEAREFFGTDDPDIAALKDIQDNLGRAAQGAHGMRSALGVEKAANAIINSFKNGPNAINSAIAASRRSVKTFIDDVQKGGDGDSGSGSGTVAFTDGGKSYQIPREMVREFMKDHPNAKR